MRRSLPFLIVALVGLAAAAGGTSLYRAKRLPALKLSPEQLATAKAGDDGPRTRGQSDAPVTLEEFADLQCPPCAALSEPIAQLEKTYRGRLRVIFRHFPLATHPHAQEAAQAAEAAGMQGRFWEMHDLLYREQAAWSQAADARLMFEAYAGTLGLDLVRFRKDFEGEPAKARIAADAKRGEVLGVAITPTVFLNGNPVPPAALRPDRLRGTIEAALKAPNVR